MSDQIWKIGDFGLASEWGSGREDTTQYASPTASYRAPELINHRKYDNKVDIWALGCIMYEVVSRKRAFLSDHSVADYYHGNTQLELPELPSEFDKLDICVLTELVQAMLQIQSRTRPSAHDILHLLERNARWTRDVVWTSECRHYIGVNHVMDALLPKRSSGVWSAVKWSPYW